MVDIKPNEEECLLARTNLILAISKYRRRTGVRLTDARRIIEGASPALTQVDLRRLAWVAWGWRPAGALVWEFMHGDGYDTYGWYLTDETGANYQVPTRVAGENLVGRHDQGRAVLTETDAYSAWAYAIGRSPGRPVDC